MGILEIAVVGGIGYLLGNKSREGAQSNRFRFGASYYSPRYTKESVKDCLTNIFISKLYNLFLGYDPLRPEYRHERYTSSKYYPRYSEAVREMRHDYTEEQEELDD